MKKVIDKIAEKRKFVFRITSLVMGVALTSLGAFKTVPVTVATISISNALIIAGLALIVLSFVDPDVISGFLRSKFGRDKK